MRKTALIVLVALLLVVAGLYLLLPRQVTLSEAIAVRAPLNAVLHSTTSEEQWQQWWPVGQTRLLYREQNFSEDQQTTSSTLVGVPVGDTIVNSLLMAIGVSRDSTIVSWEATLPAGGNPFRSIGVWLRGKRLRKDAAHVLARLKTFAEDPRNVYGVPVKEVRVTTPYLVAVRTENARYPSTEEVYTQINKLRAYVQSEGARQTAPPMLHIEPHDSAHYSFMVALPTDRLLPGRGDILQKRMVMGKLLESEVRGGDYTVQQGLAGLERYVSDYSYKSPAIPYASLTTDRTREPDTTKWVTHLYYPVF